MGRSRTCVLLFLVCCVGAAYGQVPDTEGDADIPCIDVTSMDVRGDRQVLSVTLQTSLRPFPPEYVVRGIDPSTARLCSRGRYDLTIDAGEPIGVVDVSTSLDASGIATSTGPDSMQVELDRSAGWIRWKIAVADLGVGSTPKSITLRAKSTLTLGPGSPRPPLPAVIVDVVADAGQPFLLGGDAAGIVGMNGGRITVTDPQSPLHGALLDVPPGALSGLTPISLAVPESTPKIGVGDLQGINRLSLEPHDLTLEMPATLKLPTAGAATEGTRAGALGLVQWDGEAQAWLAEFNEVSDPDLGLIGTTELRRFGMFAVWQDGLFAAGVDGDRTAKDGFTFDCFPKDGKLVVLIHGWKAPCASGDESTFGNLRTLLQEESEAAVCIFSYTTINSIRTSAKSLKKTLDAAEAEHVSLIAHSQGGLVSRTFLEDAYSESSIPSVAANVDRLTTFATPHLGLGAGRVRICKSLEEMVPGGSFLEGNSVTQEEGLNERLREKRNTDFADLMPKYRAFAAWDDRVVQQNSALGQTCGTWVNDWSVSTPGFSVSTSDYDLLVQVADTMCDICPWLISEPKLYAACTLDCIGLTIGTFGVYGSLAHNAGKGQCVDPIQEGGSRADPGSPESGVLGTWEDLFPRDRTRVIPSEWDARRTLVHGPFARLRGDSSSFPPPPNHNPDTYGIVDVADPMHLAWPSLCEAATGVPCRVPTEIFNDSFDYTPNGDFPVEWTPVLDGGEFEVDASLWWGMHPLFLKISNTWGDAEITRSTGIQPGQVRGKSVLFQASLARNFFVEGMSITWGGMTLGFGEGGRIYFPSGKGTFKRDIAAGEFGLEPWQTVYLFANYEKNEVSVYLDSDYLDTLRTPTLDPNAAGTISIKKRGEYIPDGSAFVDGMRIIVLSPPADPSGTEIITAWQPEPRLPRPLMGIGTAAYGNFILIHEPAQARKLIVLEVDPATGSLRMGPDGRAASREYPIPSGTNLGKNMTIVGSNLVIPGSPASYIGRLAADGSVSTWDSAPGITDAPGWKAVVSHGNTIFVVGGFTSGNTASLVQSATLDGSGNLSAWVARSLVPVPLHDPMAVVSGGRLLVFGGEGPNGSTTHAQDIRGAEILSADGLLGSWDTQPKLMLHARPHANYFVLDGTIHVVGGGVHNYMTASVESASLVQFGADAERFESRALPMRLNELGAVVVVGRWGYVIGGNNREYGGGPQDKIYRAVFSP